MSEPATLSPLLFYRIIKRSGTIASLAIAMLRSLFRPEFLKNCKCLEWTCFRRRGSKGGKINQTQIAIEKLLLPGEEMLRLKTKDETLNSAHVCVRNGNRLLYKVEPEAVVIESMRRASYLRPCWE